MLVFLLFVGLDGSNEGGWYDYKAMGLDLEELKQRAHYYPGNWAHIVDLEYKRICAKAVRVDSVKNTIWLWGDCWDG